MYLHGKINKVPVNSILAEGITFRKEKRRNGFQILIGDEVVWDWPRDFIDDPNETDSWGKSVGDTTWHNFHLRNLHSFLRLYIDTPRNQIDDFSKEYCDLRDVLRACDKRRGRHAAAILMFSTNSPRARKIIHYRYGRKQRDA